MRSATNPQPVHRTRKSRSWERAEHRYGGPSSEALLALVVVIVINQRPVIHLGLFLLVAPWRVLLPIASHDAADRLDLIDYLGKSILGDLRTYRAGILVGARQLREVRVAAEEACIDALSLLCNDLALADVAEALHERRPAEIASCPVRRDTEAVFGVAPARDQDRLPHVERDEREAVRVVRVVGKRWGRTFGVIEQAVGFAENEVMLVPEAVALLEAEMLGDEIVDLEVAGLGPCTNDLQRRPVVLALLRVGRNPGVVPWGLRRDSLTEILRRRHAILIEQRAGLARAVMRHERELAGRFHATDVEKVVAIALRGEVLDRSTGHRLEEEVVCERIHH